MMSDPTATLLSAFIAAGVAIWGINKAFKYQLEANKWNKLQELVLSLMRIQSKYINLIDNVNRNVVHTDAVSGRENETAKERFWKEIGPLTEDVNRLRMDLEFLTPENYYDTFDALVKKLNECRESILNQPDMQNAYPELDTKLNNAYNCLLTFKSASKNLLGLKEYKVDKRFIRHAQALAGRPNL